MAHDHNHHDEAERLAIYPTQHNPTPTTTHTIHTHTPCTHTQPPPTPGIYGPFDKFVPVLKKDGQYVLLAEEEYNRLKVHG
jgi:hypothetical protein